MKTQAIRHHSKCLRKGLRNPLTTVIAAIALSLLASTSHASKRPLFDEKAPLDAVLTVPLAQAYSQKKKDVRLYHNGTFSYKQASGGIKRLPVKVKTRGNFRRANCSMPPLRLNFAKKLVKGSLLNGQDKLKLVGPCQFGGIFKSLIGLEYLAYQVFETVSDYSLKTRLLNLSYVDSDKKRKPRTSAAFVIEDIEDLAKRHKLRFHSPEKIPRNRMNLEHTALVEVFAYFIGNNDYSTLTGLPGTDCCHNVRLLANKDSTGKFIPVPYDFDMSGLVNAPYAAPPPHLPINEVRKRYFNGWCKDDKHFRDAVEKFKQHKPEIMALVDDSTLINTAMKKKTKTYFEKFYSMADTPKRYQKEIIGRCRGKTTTS
ncbi:MAG: hypothetical protein ACI9FR_000025 [Cryomorphaceae bacterium]|jgi:hypothetical protein